MSAGARKRIMISPYRETFGPFLVSTRFERWWMRLARHHHILCI